MYPFWPLLLIYLTEICDFRDVCGVFSDGFSRDIMLKEHLLCSMSKLSQFIWHEMWKTVLKNLKIPGIFKIFSPNSVQNHEDIIKSVDDMWIYITDDYEKFANKYKFSIGFYSKNLQNLGLRFLHLHHNSG
jgi:hypothetical protein